MSTIFDYAVSFTEKELIPSISLGFLHKVGIFVKVKTPPPLEDKTLTIESQSEKMKVAPTEYMMIEAVESDYATFTDNTDIQGFFDGGAESIFLIIPSVDAASITEAKALDLNEFNTICYSSDYTTVEAADMAIDGFNGIYIAVSSVEAEAEEFQAISENNICFLDLLTSDIGYGMCVATGYHLSRNYWRNNQYYMPQSPEKIGGITDANYARTLLDKGISFFIYDKSYGTYLSFFGNTKQGIAQPYIAYEIQLKSQESLTMWTQENEPTDTLMNRILAERAANKPFDIYERAPYFYLDPDYPNKVTITKSELKYHASGDYDIKIPAPTWVYDFESTVRK
ncbi:hypothetical protein [Aliivibrio fischeri]|uniref:Uncharacterized protein n=1 Tax=Aliivibrio fischeri SR5 TaxID=1088719 RepID=A0AAV3EVI4_ALIFS|nr:hypothetical protein [Aliivibrio fischeri]EHN70924.1 hypothetical protein VFSR5_0704 [Aliivibrio fischeri SR5]